MKIFITGGAGFIGCNYADHLLQKGEELTVYDLLSRPGSELNLSWLRQRHGSKFNFIKGDVRDYDLLAEHIEGQEVVIHLAGQVAVTTSVANPREDFDINALGTLNVLEAVRLQSPQATFLNASTNKVYGGLAGVKIVESGSRYDFADFIQGIPENFPLDFHSPYGCSKGAADQYTIDYARIYGLRAVTLRQSCIYGPRQFGVEDQGWAAHFAIAASRAKPITIYGDGKQLRDMLNVNDLVTAYDLTVEYIDKVAGKAINIGGGPENTLSIWSEFGPLLEDLVGVDIDVEYQDWRPGDQRVFYSDIRRASALLNWHPQTSPEDGLAELVNWISSHQELFN